MAELPLATLPRRERLVVLASLVGVSVLAWVYLVWMATAMSQTGAPQVIHAWSPAYFLMMFSMWVIMMVGMMLPSIMPVVLLYARVVGGSKAPSRPVLRSYLFAAGYLLAWTLFSLLATLLQWGLDEAALLSVRMQTISPFVGAAVLAVTGLYQWTPVKDACLKHCRGPVDYLSSHWRQGMLGALHMGLGHGLYCIGCCWVLMTLLFVGGVMNLLVIALITLFVLFEKLAPFGADAGRWAGAGLCAVAAGWIIMTL